MMTSSNHDFTTSSEAEHIDDVPYVGGGQGLPAAERLRGRDQRTSTTARRVQGHGTDVYWVVAA